MDECWLGLKFVSIYWIEYGIIFCELVPMINLPIWGFLMFFSSLLELWKLIIFRASRSWCFCRRCWTHSQWYFWREQEHNFGASLSNKWSVFLTCDSHDMAIGLLCICFPCFIVCFIVSWQGKKIILDLNDRISIFDLDT